MNILPSIRLVLFFITTVLSILIFVGEAEVNENKVTNEKAIQIAKAYVKRYLDYNLDFMGINVGLYFTPANKYLPIDQIMFGIDSNKKRLLKKTEELKAELGKVDEIELSEKRKRISSIKDNIKEYEEHLELIGKLEKKTYWAVNFYTISPSAAVPYLGGSYTVFIDSKSGDILLSYEGL